MPRLGWRWFLVTLRILAILAWFLVIILPHLLLTLIGRRDLVPPVFLAGVGRLAGLRIETRGTLAPGRLLLVANHVSWLDILALAAGARAAFVAHAGLAQQPVLRWLCTQNDTLFIAREQRSTVAAQANAVVAALDRRRLVIFPEGTTGDGRSLTTFKSALLSAAEGIEARGPASRVQPVALDYAEAPTIAWAGEEPGTHNFLRILGRMRPVRLTVRFCEPLRDRDLVDRKAMARAAQEAIARALRD